MTSGGGAGGSAAAGGAGDGQVDVVYVEFRPRADERSLRQMEQDVQAAGTSAGTKGGEGLKGAFGGLIGTLPGMAIAAAAAVGAALVGGVVSATNFAQQARQGVKEIGAELGVSGAEAQRLGEIAKKVFGNNWATDLGDAQKAVATVRKEVKGLTDEDLQAVTEGSLAIADRFQEDQAKVAQSVQSVMQATGASAQEAMDLITAGFQRGLNKSGDYLDTLNEYGPQFEKAKLSGSQLFSLLETGSAAGALGTDKVADALKEFSLRAADGAVATKQAYAQLGLDYDKLTKDLSTGALTYGDLFSLVTTKIKGVQDVAARTNITTALLGGAGEDLASKLGNIDLAKTKLSELKGSTDQVKDSYNTLGSVFQTAGRQVLLQLQPIGDLVLDLANEAMPTVQAAIQRVGPVVTTLVRGLVDGFNRGREVAGEFAPVIQRGIGVVLPVVQSLGNVVQSTFGLIVTLWENVLRPAIEAILPVVTTVFGGIGRIVKVMLDTVTNIINAVSALFRGDFKGALDFLKAAVEGAFTGLQKALDDVVPKLLEKGKQLGIKIVEGFRSGLTGLGAYLLTALADAIDKAAEGAPAVVKRLFGAVAGAARNEAAQLAGQSQDARQNVQAASFSGLGQTPGSFLELLKGLGLQNYGVSADYAGHTGKDVRTPVGTALYAAQGSKIEYGFEKGGYGLYLKLTDDKGFKTYLAHLSGISTDLVEQIKKTGSAFVNAGTFLGRTGGDPLNPNSQNSSGPHVHVELRDPSGKVINLNRYGVNAPAPAPAPTPAPKPTPTSGGGPTATPGPTVPLKPEVTAKDIQTELSAKLAGIQARVQLKLIGPAEAIRELKVLEDSAIAAGRKGGENMGVYAQAATQARSAIDGLKKGGGEAVDVLAALQTQYDYAGKKGLPAYVAGLQSYIAQQDKAAQSAKQGSKEQLEAMGNVARARKVLQEAQSTDQLGLMAADVARFRAGAQEVVKLEKGLTTSTDLEWRRRAENRIAAFNAQGQTAQDVLALVKGTDAVAAQLAAKAEDRDKDAAKKAESAARLRQTALDNVSKAVAEGRTKDAERSLSEARRLQATELGAANLTAEQRVRIYEASSGKILKATYGLHAEGRRQADAAVDAWARSEEAKALTTTERDAEVLRRKAANRTAEKDANLAAQREQEGLIRAATDLQIAEGERAATALRDQAQKTADLRYKLTADLLRYSYGEGDKGLTAALDGYGAADPSDVLGSLAELERRAPQVAKLIREVYGEQIEQVEFFTREAAAAAEANSVAAITAIATIASAEQEAADDAAITVDGLRAQVRELIALGRDPRTSGFAVWLDELIQKGGKAGEAAAFAKKNLEGMILAAKLVADGPDPAGDIVDARRTRPAAVTPTAARRTDRSSVMPSTVTEDRNPVGAWQETTRAAEDTAAAVAAYREKLTLKTDAELADAKAAAYAAGQQLQYAATVAETEDRTKKAEAAHKSWADNLERIAWDEHVASLKDLSDAELVAALEATRASENVAEFNALLAEIKDRELNVTVTVNGIDTGIKALDLFKTVAEGAGNAIQGVFSDLVSGSETSVQGILANMAKMALGIVKSVAVSIAAYQAQAIALALISGASFNFVQAGLALAAAAAVAGIAAGLETRLGQQATAATPAASTSSTGTSTSSSSTTSASAATTNAQVTVPTSQVTVTATPEGFTILSTAAKDFRDGVAELREVFRSGVKTDVRVTQEAARRGNSLEYELTTGT